jgi:hypothetical protein
MATPRLIRQRETRAKHWIGWGPVLAFIAFLAVLLVVGPIVDNWVNRAEDEWLATHHGAPHFIDRRERDKHDAR